MSSSAALSSSSGQQKFGPAFEAFLDQEIPSCTVERLKSVITSLEIAKLAYIKKTGKKAELVQKIQDHYKSYRDINDLYNYNKAKVIFDRICFNASASRGVWQSADAAPILMGPEGYDRAKADGSLANRERMGLTASGYADEPAFLSILQAEMARARDPSNPNRAVNGIPAASSSRAGGVAGYGADNRSARQSSAGGTFGSYMAGQGHGTAAGSSSAPFRHGQPALASSYNRAAPNYGVGSLANQFIAKNWKPTPGWKVIKAVTDMHKVDLINEGESSTKKNKIIYFQIPPDVLLEMSAFARTPTGYASSTAKNPTRTLRLFCTSSDYYPCLTNEPIPIEWPHNSEIYVNSQPVHYKKGLKGKANSAAPADLESGNAMKKVSGIQNAVNLFHTGPTMNKKTKIPKSFYFQVCWTETYVDTDIRKVVEKGERKSAEEILGGIQAQNADADIEMGSYKLSLKDPMAFMRIAIPIRSIVCTHLQCFDLTCWLLANGGTPQWECPVCERPLQLDQIFMDGYTESILKACPDSVDEVIVENDGEWHSENGKYGSARWMASKASTSNSTPFAPSPSISERGTPDSIAGSEPVTRGAGPSRGPSAMKEVFSLDSDDDDGDVDMPLRVAVANGSNRPPEPQSEPEDAVIDLCSDSDDDAGEEMAQNGLSKKLCDDPFNDLEPHWAKDIPKHPTLYGGIKRKREDDELEEGEEEELDDDRVPDRPSQHRRLVDSPIEPEDPYGHTSPRRANDSLPAATHSRRQRDTESPVAMDQRQDLGFPRIHYRHYHQSSSDTLPIRYVDHHPLPIRTTVQSVSLGSQSQMTISSLTTHSVIATTREKIPIQARSMISLAEKNSQEDLPHENDGSTHIVSSVLPADADALINTGQARERYADQGSILFDSASFPSISGDRDDVPITNGTNTDEGPWDVFGDDSLIPKIITSHPHPDSPSTNTSRKLVPKPLNLSSPPTMPSNTNSNPNTPLSAFTTEMNFVENMLNCSQDGV